MSVLVLLPLLGGCLAATAPAWPSSYMVRGTLAIPFAEIEEPFAAWVDLDMKKSRIDYYKGTVKTFQRGDLKSYGTSVKVMLSIIKSFNYFQPDADNVKLSKYIVEESRL